MSLLDPSVINGRIQTLDQERAALQKSLTDTSKYEQQARDITSLLRVAIANNDLNTIDGLILSNGDVPTLLRARALVEKKLELLNKVRLEGVKRALLSRLKEVGDVFQLETLKEIKKDISVIDDSVLRQQLSMRLLKTVEQLKEPMIQKFLELLSASQWLKKNTISAQLRENFIDLVNLQSLTESHIYPDSLWAFDSISTHFKISFDYHFNNSSNSITSIDKPELFLDYLINYLTANISKISRLWSLQGTELHERFAHSEFITSALSPITSKLAQFIETLSHDNDDDTLELLTHLVNEVIQFDTKLIDEFYYDPLNDSSWPGLFNNLHYEHLERLLLRNIKLYSSQFDTIINHQNNFQIDYTSVNEHELKPTISSLKFKMLIENLTFKNFTKFFKINYDNNNALITFKLKTFSKIYLNLLQQYLKVLQDGHDAFLELFRASKSIIHSTNVSNAQTVEVVDISTTNGLERIFRLYSSLKFISNSLNQWNQEFIFIELNQLFNEHSKESSISMFDLILKDYDRLESRIWKLFESFISTTIKQSLRNYANLNNWNQSNTTFNDILKPSDELQHPLSLLISYDNLFKRTTPGQTHSDFKKFLKLQILDFFINSIVKSNHFNKQGILQFIYDFEYVTKELRLENIEQFPKFFKFSEFVKIMKICGGVDGHVELESFEGLSLNQFAKIGKFDAFREELNLKWVNDNEILDVLLRIHQ